MYELKLTDSLADLHTFAVVTATCGSCQHVATLDIWKLAVRCGWETPAQELCSRLKCSRCGARAPAITVHRRGKDRRRR